MCIHICVYEMERERGGEKREIYKGKKEGRERRKGGEKRENI